MIMRAEFINPFLASLMNVLKTMASLELKPQKPRVKKDEIARGDVSGLIGMVGQPTRGSMSITFDETLALEIMQNMLGERPNGLNDEVTDMVGEITNMVAGGAKRILSESGFLERTPLWYYILKEAEGAPDGNHLGTLGSLVTARTFISLLLEDANSYLNDSSGNWTPANSALTNATGKIISTIMDLLQFAQVA